MITQEHEYYLRFILLLLQGGTEVLREIAAKTLQKCNTSLTLLLSKNASVIQNTRNLSKKQKDILYPSSPTVVSDIKDYDITLLSYLITNFLTGNLDSNEKNAVDKIKEMRNVYHAHAKEAKMTAATYTKEWNKLMRIILTVSQNLPEEQRNSLSKLIDSIENEELDINVVINEIKKLDQTNDFFEYIKKSIDDLNQNIDARFRQIEQDMLEIKMKMENQGKKTKVVNTVRGRVTLSADEQETVDYAEKLLLEVSKDCVEKSQTEHNKPLKEKVGSFVEDVEKLDIKFGEVSEGSIIFEFKCFSLSAILDLIDYFNSSLFKARLREIAAALEDVTGNKINVSGSLDIQSFQDVINNMQEKRYEKVVNFEMECTGVDGLLHAIGIFEGGKAANSLNELSTALSESVGKPVTLNTSIDIDEMQRAVDSIRKELDCPDSDETSTTPLERDVERHAEYDTVMAKADTVTDTIDDESSNGNSVAPLNPSSELKVGSHFIQGRYSTVEHNKEETDRKTSSADCPDSDETSTTPLERDVERHAEYDTVMAKADTVTDTIDDESSNGNSVAPLNPSSELKVGSHFIQGRYSTVEHNKEETDRKTSSADCPDSDETSTTPLERDVERHAEYDTVMAKADTVTDTIDDESSNGNSVAPLNPSSELKVGSHFIQGRDFTAEYNKTETDRTTSPAGSESDGISIVKTVTRKHMKQPPLIKQLKGNLSEYPDEVHILKVRKTPNVAPGRGHYTPENEYFFRYFRLVFETGPKVLRKVLTFAAGSSSVEAYLHTNIAKINRLRVQRILSTAEYNIIFPANNSLFNLEIWNVTLLCAVIINVCTLSHLAKDEIKNIRLAHLAIVHHPNPYFEKQDFEQRWFEFLRSIYLLLTLCQDDDFETEILDEMKLIQKSPLNIAPVLEVKTNSDAKDNIQECQMKLKQTQETLERSLDKISKTVDIICDEEQLYTRVSKSDQTSSVLRRNVQYIPTEQMLMVERTLEEKGVVIISGGPGEGKTATAIELMRRQSKTKRCIQIFSPNELHRIKPNQVQVVFIDDIFGSHGLDERKQATWYPVLDKLYYLVNENAFKLIIATRVLVSMKSKVSVKCRKLFDDENVFCLKSENLSITEKENILSGALEVKGKPVKIELVKKCIKSFSSDLGFPYMCMLFASNEEFFKDEALFFQRNYSYVGRIVSDLVQTKRIALMFIWFKGCTFVNRTEENDCLLSELCKCVQYEDELDELYRKIHDQLETMEGVFVHRNKEGYKFQDSTIYDATGFYLARKGMFEKIIKCCSIDFLMENISVKEDPYRAHVYIRKEYYNCLVDRVITEVLEKNNVNTVTMHTCLNSVDFLIFLIEELKKTKDYFRFFTVFS